MTRRLTTLTLLLAVVLWPAGIVALQAGSLDGEPVLLAKGGGSGHGGGGFDSGHGRKRGSDDLFDDSRRGRGRGSDDHFDDSHSRHGGRQRGRHLFFDDRGRHHHGDDLFEHRHGEGIFEHEHRHGEFEIEIENHGRGGDH